MELKKFTIAGGNSTLLVWNCKRQQRIKVVAENLGKVEQIGFVETTINGMPKLIMMGGELCINALIALASQSEKKGYLLSIGSNKVIKYYNENNLTTIELELLYKRRDNLVLFQGIGFIFNEEIKATRETLKELCLKFTLPAFGCINLKGNKIFPIIYVKGTDSLVEETACGSGSIASSIVTDEQEIVQPTNEIIKIMKKDNLFTVQARVARMR